MTNALLTAFSQSYRLLGSLFAPSRQEQKMNDLDRLDDHLLKDVGVTRTGPGQYRQRRSQD